MFLLGAAAFCGCEHNELIPEESGLVPLNIRGSIEQVATKATADGFVDGDGVGLYAVNYQNSNATPGTLQASGNQADNVKYVLSESEGKWVPVRSVYYKDVNTNVDLYTYYPYIGSITDVAAMNFEVKQDQSSAATSSSLAGYEASDFLWGKAENVAPTESSTAIVLRHKMAGLNVLLAEGTGFADGEFAQLEKSVLVLGTTRKATIDMSTGTVTPLGGPQSTGIVMAPQEDGSYRAVAVPQEVAASVQLLAITIDGVVYSFTRSAATSLTAGKMTKMTVNVNKKTPSGDYELTAGDFTITDWTEDRNTHGGEARQYFVVNVETMGTLGATIRVMGKNPDKIKNLKVTGQVNTADFYFMRDSMAILQAVNMKETEVYGVVEDKTEWGVIPDRAFCEKGTLTSFVFPEHIKYIGECAFWGTSINGHLDIPDDVETIGYGAFCGTYISSVYFPAKLKYIKERAFCGCSSLSCQLVLPESLIEIQDSAFYGCKFSGLLKLPDSLESIGVYSFAMCGPFSGGLSIPEKVKCIPACAFQGTSFSGPLNLNNVTELGSCSFWECYFSGELIIPEGLTKIPDYCFCYNSFSSVIFPESLLSIGVEAFAYNSRLMGTIEIPEGAVKIGEKAFMYDGNINSIHLPSTFQVIGKEAFYLCCYVTDIRCSAIEPPTVQSGAFDGVAKDNFTVEVPAASVKRYQAESGWSDFKRISVHYDFSISRERMRALNAALEKTYTLRVPSGMSWSVSEKPDWVTVTPSSGTGKTDVTVSVSAMPRTSDTFEVNEGSFNYPSYVSYPGRAGKIVFLLDEKNYTCSMEVEQYDYDYSDGDVKTYQTATKGKGIDVVFIGDGYDAKDIAKGIFLSNAEQGYGHLFDLEPYKTYKDYFNVYGVISMSDESGIGTVNTVVDTKFGSYFTQNRLLAPDADGCFSWARKADSSIDFAKSLVIMMMNTPYYEGVTMMYGDGSAIACCPVSTDAYPYDYRGIIQHEAGGHGFGKLGDEYIYHNEFIYPGGCLCCEHPKSDVDLNTSYGYYKSLGWYKNLSMYSDNTQVPWAHLIYNPKYSNMSICMRAVTCTAAGYIALRRRAV